MTHDDLVTRHYIKRGNLLKTLKGTFLDPVTRAPEDLTGSTLAFYMTDPATETNVINGAAAQILGDPTLGRFEYVWIAGDTDRPPGAYPFECVATFPNGKTLTSPNRRHGTVVIIPALATPTP